MRLYVAIYISFVLPALEFVKVRKRLIKEFLSSPIFSFVLVLSCAITILFICIAVMCSTHDVNSISSSSCLRLCIYILRNCLFLCPDILPVTLSHWFLIKRTSSFRSTVFPLCVSAIFKGAALSSGTPLVSR